MFSIKVDEHIIRSREFGSWRGEFHWRKWWIHEVLEDKAIMQHSERDDLCIDNHSK